MSVINYGNKSDDTVRNIYFALCKFARELGCKIKVEKDYREAYRIELIHKTGIRVGYSIAREAIESMNGHPDLYQPHIQYIKRELKEALKGELLKKMSSGNEMYMSFSDYRIFNDKLLNSSSNTLDTATWSDTVSSDDIFNRSITRLEPVISQKPKKSNKNIVAQLREEIDRDLAGVLEGI